MLQLLFYLLAALIGFTAAFILFPQNSDYNHYMTHQNNCTEDYYDTLYNTK